MEEIVLIDAVERYLRGEMSAEERASWKICAKTIPKLTN